jgi:microcystin-dependent protein
MKTTFLSFRSGSKTRKSFIVIACLFFTLSFHNAAKAQDAYMGEIRMFPFNFIPRGWLACDGSLLLISQNASLFALIGTFYGGNGTTNFALPDLRGRIPMGVGNGPGLSPTVLAQQQGLDSTTLVLSQLPDHTHPIYVFNGPADTSVTNLTSGLNSIAIPVTPGLATSYGFSRNPPNTILHPGTVGSVGNTTPVPLKQPSLTLTFAICVSGIFPSGY